MTKFSSHLKMCRIHHLYNLNNQGFQTWISKAYKLSWSYVIDMDSCTQLTPGQFKHICHERVKSYFVSTWLSDLHSGDTSIARTYRLYKSSFGTEFYLKSISNLKLRVALSKLRASSHDLKIERGRYVRPKLNVDEWLCLSCNFVENEEHFVTACKDNEVEPALYTNKLEKRDPSFANLTNREKFIFLMTCADSQILTWFGKFIYHSFLNLNMLRLHMRI